ncbi:MAG: hypothetical protein R2697_03720 [Ilumatobacteraceae bacterium]
MAFIDLSKKPTGALKWFLKAPSYLFRAKLGFLFGKRFVMIEHRGRKSGNLYRTVIEVAGRKPEASEYICTSGTGRTPTGIATCNPTAWRPSGSAAAVTPTPRSDSSRPTKRRPSWPSTNASIRRPPPSSTT